MIRGTPRSTSTILYYQEKIIAWIRCEEALRSRSFREAVIRLKRGDEECTGRVPFRSLHPDEDIVQSVVVGEILGGENHGLMVLDFAPTQQDERFRIIAREEDLDAICEKNEILESPVSLPPSWEKEPEESEQPEHEEGREQ